MIAKLEIKEFVPEGIHHAEPVEIWKARNFVREHAGEKLSLGKVAKAANISPNYLSEKFKAVTGENLVRYIGRTRVEQARNLLLDPKLRVSEIAFAVGFQSLSQFNRVFKKLCGKSPTEYRLGLLNNGQAMMPREVPRFFRINA